jgi:hypothetical protein
MDAGSLAQRAGNMGELDISAHPLLDQGRKQSGCEAEHQAQCPHSVDPNDRGGRRTRKIVLRRDECTIRELLRNLPEIKRISVAGIGGQLFIAFNEKGSDGCRE